MTHRILRSVLLALAAASCASTDDPSSARTHYSGANLGRPQDPLRFKRATPGCSCPSDPHLGDCKCLHCGGEAGARCYCQQKRKSSCLCGIDMPSCACVHCAGREGEECETCPCDHSETRSKLETE